MVTPPGGTHHELVGAADVSSAQALGDNNDVDIKSTNKSSPKSAPWREGRVVDRKRRKASYKIQ